MAELTLLTPGNPAPDFTLKDQNDAPVSLKDFRGKTVVLVFYPKDNSPVCSVQLSEYAAQYRHFTDSGAEILGISRDDAESHNRFAATCAISFPLLTDPDGAVCRAYDTLGMFGTVKRHIFIIGEDGTIRHILKKFSLFYVPANELLELL